MMIPNIKALLFFLYIYINKLRSRKMIDQINLIIFTSHIRKVKMPALKKKVSW